MKSIAAVLFIYSLLCIAQAPTYHPLLPDAFSKTSLRALLAIKSETVGSSTSENSTDLLINEVNLAAKSGAETKVLADLQTIQANKILNFTMRRVSWGAAAAEARLLGVPIEDALEAFEKDPKSVVRREQVKVCAASLDDVLRSQQYKPLPAICNQQL